MSELSWSEKFFLLAQRRLLPKQALTELMGHLADKEAGGLTTAAIRLFAQRYGVNLQEADNPDPASYPSFNAFFARPLKAGARPLAASRWISPVDGAVSQIGPIAQDRVYQAKGHDYSLLALLGGDAQRAAQFEDGQFATLYLSPKDYHRIHMPCAGELQRMVYVPGELYSVNPLTAQNVPGLFARNERLVCFFNTADGPLALVLVAATVVGKMATVWHGRVNEERLGQIQAWDYAAGEVSLAQGEEMGRFLLGSTVVMCWPKAAGLVFAPGWQEGLPIQMGQAMAEQTHAA